MNVVTDNPMTPMQRSSRRSVAHRRNNDTARTESLASASLASLGHDLGTRLTVIGAAASNLKSAPLRVEDQHDQVDLIVTEVGRLNWLLHNILEMGRLEANATGVDVGWVDAEDVVSVARRQWNTRCGSIA